MAEANSTRTTAGAESAETTVHTINFDDADNRHELFDIRALGNSAYALLENEADIETQGDLYRLVRMIVDRSADAIAKIDKAEEIAFAAAKGGAV